MQLTTIESLREYLGLGDTATGKDAFLVRCIEQAEDTINRHCNRAVGASTTHGFVTGTKVEYFDGDYARSVILAYTPVTAVASVVRITGASSAGVETSDAIDMTRLTVDGFAIGGTFSAEAGILAFRSESTDYVASWDSGEPLPPQVSNPNFGGGRGRIKVTYTGGYAATAIPRTLQLAANQLAANIFRLSGQSTMKADSVPSFDVDRWEALIATFVRRVT